MWPVYNVKRGVYRFRLLNGCNARFINLRFRVAVNVNGSTTYVGDPLPFTLIATDGGFLSSVRAARPLSTRRAGRGHKL